MKIYLISAILALLILNSCSDVNAPLKNESDLVGSWVSESVTLTIKPDTHKIETPDNYKVKLTIFEDGNFELTRSTDKDNISDFGLWNYSENEIILKLSCETGLEYDLDYDPTNSTILFKSYEFFDLELYEIKAILVKSKV